MFSSTKISSTCNFFIIIFVLNEIFKTLFTKRKPARYYYSIYIYSVCQKVFRGCEFLFSILLLLIFFYPFLYMPEHFFLFFVFIIYISHFLKSNRHFEVSLRLHFCSTFSTPRKLKIVID